MDEWDAKAAAHERFYWNVIETQCEDITVDYANDQDMSKYGSAFADNDRGTGAPNPWDLRAFPVLRQSVLRKLDQDVEGVTRPWLYYGSLFSTFCWHTEASPPPPLPPQAMGPLMSGPTHAPASIAHMWYCPIVNLRLRLHIYATVP